MALAQSGLVAVAVAALVAVAAPALGLGKAAITLAVLLGGIAFGVAHFVTAAQSQSQVAVKSGKASKSKSNDKQSGKKSAGKQQSSGNKKSNAAAKKAPVEESESEESEEEVKPKKGKKSAAKEEPKKAAPKKDDKPAAKKAAAQKPVESEDEEEEGDGEPKTMTKSALKKAKKAAAEAKKLLELKKLEEAAKKAAADAKKKAKKGVKTVEKAVAAAVPAAVASVVSAANQFAHVVEDGWEHVQKRTSASSKAQAREKEQQAVVKSGKKEQADEPQTDANGNVVEKPKTVELRIPAKAAANIIGIGGANLKALQTETGANITMPKKDSGSDVALITGSAEAVKIARAAIESLIERGFSSITHPGMLSDDLNVDPKAFGLIIGPSGANLRSIQTKTNTRINLPEKNSDSHKVVIVGKKEDIKEAKQAIKDLLKDGFSVLTHEGCIKLEIDFPKDKLGFLIGPKGQTIKSIQGNTRTKINIPDKNGASSIVSVVGLPKGVAQAQKEILRLLEPVEAEEVDSEDEQSQQQWSAEHTADGEDALWE